METFVVPPAVRAGLERLIDYAGLFPPAQLPLEDAVRGYDEARATAPAWMLGRFIVPAARLVALRSALAGRERFELSVIATPEMFNVVACERRADWASIGAIEVPLGAGTIEACADALAKAGLHDLPAYIELPELPELPAHTSSEHFGTLLSHGLGAKLRCGGVVPEAFPSVARVTEFIAVATIEDVPFKATAGLHHPVRHFNEALGVKMHGFLNLLAAAAFAPLVDRATLEAIVGEEDPESFELGERLRWREHTLDARALAATRARRFVGYGSCSFDEPVDDLRAMRVLAPA